MAYTASHLNELLADWRAVQNERPVLRAVAWSYVRRELIRFLQGCCTTTIGAYAAVTPSALKGHDYVTTVGLVLTSVLFVQGLLVSTQSLWDWRTRYQVSHLLHMAQRPADGGESGP